MNTEFHFNSTAFNITDPKNYFLNNGCFGDDVARWLIGRLRSQGIQNISEPDQEDFGWFFTFRAGDVEHCVVVYFQPNDMVIGDQWIGWIERQTNFLSGLLGGRSRGISPAAIEAIDIALRSSPEIHNLSWHKHER